MATIGGRSAAAMFESTDRHPAWASYVTVDDVDATTAKARELGANVLAEPFDVMGVGRMSTIQDPTGAVLCLWQPRTSIGAEIVNTHGALSMNQLNTSDPEAVMRRLMEVRYPVYSQADIVVDSRNASHRTVVCDVAAALTRHLGDRDGE